VTDGLLACFDEQVAVALREWAAGKGGDVRLPSQPWEARGLSGSVLVAIVLDRPARGGRVGSDKLIVKVLPANTYAGETGRHEQAWRWSPEFAQRRLVRQLEPRYPVGDGRFLMFQEITGSLLDSRNLSRLPIDHRASACGSVTRMVLHEWNGAPWPHPDAPPAESLPVHQYLRAELRDAIESVYAWATAENLLDIERVTTEGTDQVYANPLRLLEPGSAGSALVLDYLVGLSHGDLHADNVLVPYRPPEPPRLTEARLVDLSGFDARASLTRDLAALTVSMLLPVVRRELDDDESRALLDFVIEPCMEAPGALRKWVCESVWAITTTADEYTPTNWRDEWRAQRLLSLLAQALIATTFDNAEEHGRRWYFRLAGCAADAFLRGCGLPPGATRPEVVRLPEPPGRRAEPSQTYAGRSGPDVTPASSPAANPVPGLPAKYAGSVVSYGPLAIGDHAKAAHEMHLGGEP